MNPDIAVIGGGPAGSAAATMLARQGWRVVLLERERFPREHVGESLLPASMPVLEELGAMDAVKGAGFLPKYGATMVWGRDPEPWSWHFRETSIQYPHAYQVWRPTFDHILLDNARANDVDVREGHRVTSVAWGESANEAAVRFVSDTAGEGELAARFVVDASGQAALLAQQELGNGTRSFRTLPSTPISRERLPCPPLMRTTSSSRPTNKAGSGPSRCTPAGAASARWWTTAPARRVSRSWGRGGS